jgi:hypothetical protein
MQISEAVALACAGRTAWFLHPKGFFYSYDRENIST